VHNTWLLRLHELALRMGCALNLECRTMGGNEVPMNTSIPFTGMVTIERDERPYTARWRVQGNKLIVDWDNSEEPVWLGMFEKEPETLAKLLLAELLDRKLR
jgi:hypothetical protein